MCLSFLGLYVCVELCVCQFFFSMCEFAVAASFVCVGGFECVCVYVCFCFFVSVFFFGAAAD